MYIYLLVFRSIVTKKMMQKAFTLIHCSVAYLLEVVGCILVSLGKARSELFNAPFVAYGTPHVDTT
jgi:hypothetical protein